MLDILIQNGLLVDGSGAPGYLADVAVKDGKIVKIAPAITEPAKEVIDVITNLKDVMNGSKEKFVLNKQTSGYFKRSIM